MAEKRPDSSPKDKAKKKQGEKKKSPSPDKSKIITVTEEELREMIEKRAYELFLERGEHHGENESDWYRAEEEIKSRLKKKK